MRGWIAVALVIVSGCKFSSHGIGVDGGDDGGGSGSGSGGSGGSGSDGPGEAMPPAACATSADYTLTYNGHAYRPISDDKTHDEQVAECTKDGAHLVTIDDAGEDMFVSSNVDQGWIGIDDLTAENARSGGSDGVAVSFRWPFPSTTTYANWNGGEPNDSNDAEDCVYTDHNSSQKWNDTNCGDTRGAMCECEANVPAHPVPACMAMSGDVIDGRLYIKSSANASWDDALAFCTGIGAYLFTPEDNTENGYIADPLGVGPDVWIGMSDHAVAHQFAWANGSTDTYTHFEATKPTTNDATTTCVSIHNKNIDINNSYWTNRKCSESHPYVCECDPWGPTN